MAFFDDWDSGWIAFAGEFGGIAPVGNIGNLGRRKGDDFIVVITAEKYVEIMKITAGSTEDGYALQGFSLTRIFALVLSMLSLGMGGRL